MMKYVIWFLSVVILSVTGSMPAPASQASPAARQLTVLGTSMSPTIQPGDRVSMRSIDPTLLKRGDLVAVQFKTLASKMLKRVIALPGDRVAFIDGRILLNGQWLATSWWSANRRLPARAYKLLSIQLERYEHVLPSDKVIVFGDNAANSFDSGDFGMVSLSQLVGQIELQK